ncbi:unnamed protein product [Acidocella sp. C78]|nr:unnamed protein product [Acidocella sp. C78]
MGAVTRGVAALFASALGSAGIEPEVGADRAGAVAGRQDEGRFRQGRREDARAMAGWARAGLSLPGGARAG